MAGATPRPGSRPHPSLLVRAGVCIFVEEKCRDRFKEQTQPHAWKRRRKRSFLKSWSFLSAMQARESTSRKGFRISGGNRENSALPMRP